MITLIAITDSDKHFTSAIAEYTKRMGKSVKLVDIKPTKNKNLEICKKRDTEAFLAELSKSRYDDSIKLFLSILWVQKTTEQLAHDYGNKDLVLWIGGPYGLIEEELEWYITQKIGFGKATMPHGLVKLVALEQLYRIHTISIWKKYHY